MTQEQILDEVIAKCVVNFYFEDYDYGTLRELTLNYISKGYTDPQFIYEDLIRTHILKYNA